ncbi:MAG: hypothetical protein ACKOFG_13380 [Limnohabitans sp.]|jgi:hypothetical protein
MNIQRLSLLLIGALTHWGASAHEGHGLLGSAHWHATDVLGFVGVALVAAAVWFIGRGK